MSAQKKQRTPRQINLQKIDVLIFHGKSLSLVNYLVDLFRSMGVHAAKVMDLPSRKLTQERRVSYYLKRCGIPLVVATFDEDDLKSCKARPNVYDEIARCRELRPTDTLVLQERRGQSLVELASNVSGQLVIIEFEQEKLHLMIPRLLSEIRNRGLPAYSQTSEATVQAGSTLNDFLDLMDSLWDYQFDAAWAKIHRRDYEAERNFAETLDQFFQIYHSVFDALVRKKTRGDELRTICSSAYDNAVGCATRAWEYVAQAKLRMIDPFIDSGDRSKTGLKCRELYDEASHNLWLAKGSTDRDNKMRLFSSVVDIADKCLRILRR
jgi:hypothetical protein